MVKLSSVYVSEQTSFQYNTKLYKGNYLPTDGSPTIYLIPLEEGISDLEMLPLTVSPKPFEPISPDPPFTGVGFYFEKPSVICAPRKGIVSEIKMDVENFSTGPSDFDSENFVEIYHQDGTFTRLSGLKAGSAEVNLGQTVFPGQPVAESSNTSNSDKYAVKMIQSRWEMGDTEMVWVNFPVNIYAHEKEVKTDQTITGLESSHPSELISKEMDKKELK